MSRSEISNYRSLEIALEGKTAFTLHNWFEVQYLRVKISYLGCLNYIYGHAPYQYQWRDVNLRPHNRNLYKQ